MQVLKRSFIESPMITAVIPMEIQPHIQHLSRKPCRHYTCKRWRCHLAEMLLQTHTTGKT